MNILLEIQITFCLHLPVLGEPGRRDCKDNCQFVFKTNALASLAFPQTYRKSNEEISFIASIKDEESRAHSKKVVSSTPRLISKIASKRYNVVAGDESGRSRGRR